MFEVSPYHLLLAAFGTVVIMAYWLPRFVSGREPAASALLIALGYAAFGWIPGMPETIDPIALPKPWEIVSELCVIAGLFGVGLRIDRLSTWRTWSPTVRLLAVAMPLCIVTVAVLGVTLAGMTVAGALLLAAVLAPTDPVLAGDVQVGAPTEGGEHPVRFALTTEAGLNDGLAFPFVYLALAIAASGVTAAVITEWLWLDVAYRIAVGTASGAALGWLLGKLLFSWPGKNPLADTESGVIALAGMTLAGALLLGSVLAPTDPVLAGDVQVGPPTEGGEHPVRFSLTAEAGLNDGLAFPFVYLGLIVAAEGFAPGSWALEWLARDVLYRIFVGVAAGAAIGWILGRVLFAVPARNVLADTGSGVLALAGVLLCYGLTELLEGYGFVAAFVAGLALRRAEVGHAFHGKLHGFNVAIEHALTALLLILIGGVLPLLWPELDWQHMAIGLALIFVIRPLTGWWGLRGTELMPRERFVVAAYGVRGIGSIYYLGYATSHLDFVNEGQLWATIAFTIAVSTVVHGLTAGAVVERVTRDEEGARG
jgi:NhaP-type Na+/H+ or K+/H+ antiporter